MSGDSVLPKGFEALAPFVAAWAIDGTANRAARRSASAPLEREAFFVAASRLLDAALQHLDSKPLNDLSPADQHLMNLMLSLAHIALAVEIQGPDEEKSAPWRDRMRINRSPADTGRVA